MLRLTLFVITSLFLLGCKPSIKNLTPEQIVTKYFDGLNELDIAEIKPYISDRILITEGGYKVAKDFKDYHVFFQWDSVFSPKYKLIETKQISDNAIEVTVSKFCDRIKFLHDSPTVYRALVNIENNKISKMEHSYVVFDFEKWQSRRDSLVNWADTNHPNFSGFINDLTLNGGQNYLKVIELYKNRSDEH